MAQPRWLSTRVEHQSHRASVRNTSLERPSGTRSHAIDLEPSAATVSER